jgi:hypothetical protein
MTRLKRMLSFSNVIALIALFVALGGSVYAAGKINGKQIKSNSIPGNRLKTGSVTGKQVKAGSLTGKQVVGSSLTGVSASSLASVTYVSSAPVTMDASVPGGEVANATAACPAGMKVIGGGATVGDDQKGFVNDTGPTADRNGWTATGFAFGEPTTMVVTAVCTAVVTATG